MVLASGYTYNLVQIILMMGASTTNSNDTIFQTATGAQVHEITPGLFISLELRVINSGNIGTDTVVMNVIGTSFKHESVG